MGMYTEFVLKCEVKDNLPDNVLSVLNFLFNWEDEPNELMIPKHPFFKCQRWRMIGHCSSYYHVPFVSSRFADGYIFSRSDHKNYDGEIDKFLDWIRPYIAEFPGHCIGWSWYEEEDVPTLIILTEEGYKKV